MKPIAGNWRWRQRTIRGFGPPHICRLFCLLTTTRSHPPSRLSLTTTAMPGRVSARASRASAAGQLSHKASSQGLRSTRTSVDDRGESPGTDIPDEGDDNVLRKHVTSIFADSQKSTSGHRKLVINLRKIQEACCYDTGKKGKLEDEFDEDDFNREVVRCVLRSCLSLP